MEEGSRNVSNRILILGASGFIGNTIYKELLPYFDVYGTYAHQHGLYGENQVFYEFFVESEGDELSAILNEVMPSVIISALKGPFEALKKVHKSLCEYCLGMDATLLYISSSQVFDAYGKFPSYEFDIPKSQSLEGVQKIQLEKLIQTLPESQYAILRLPLVLGVNAPILFMLKQAIKHQASFDVYPNLIVSATTSDKMAQQIHYIINHHCTGIYHLASEDVMHHDEIFREISDRISSKRPVFKKVYSSNEDLFLALLPKENKLPKNYRITIAEVIEDSTLKDEIVTLKN